MAEFENQAALREQLISDLEPIIPELEAWRKVWAKIPDSKKIEWLVDGKSMFVSAAAGIFIYLYPFFKSLCDEIDSGQIILNLDTMTLRTPDDV